MHPDFIFRLNSVHIALFLVNFISPFSKQFHATEEIRLIFFMTVSNPPDIIFNSFHATRLFLYLLKPVFLMFSGGIKRNQGYEMS